MRWPAAPRVIRGQQVVLPSGITAAAIHVEQGRIARVGSYDDIGAASATEVLDAGAHTVLPGLVDTHVHVNEPGRTEWEGFTTATRAAAAGGVTTLLDMPLNSIPATTTVAALQAKRASAANRCHVDVGFIGGVVPSNARELAPLRDHGVLACKCFLVPSGVAEFEHVTASDLETALPVLARLGVPLMVHAELPGPIDDASRHVTGDPRAYSTYLATRPARAETAAVELLIDLATRHGAHVHVVHVSAAETIPILQDARRRGLPITAETCPHYLTFSADDVGDGATEFKCAPPIRDAANRHALWAALERGALDCVVSDHSPAPPELKLRATARTIGDFLRAWGGIASLELGLSAVWSGLRERGGSALSLARWMCGAPARLVGLNRRKGAIAVGGDADFAIVDLDAAFVVDAGALQQRHKLTPYAGRRLHGRVAATYLRGELVYAGGAPVGAARGRLLDAS